MTDNEKAATFIGWQPMTHHGKDGVDEALVRIGEKMPFAAPDMSDPRNYMKALEAVDALEVIFQQYEGLNVCIYKEQYREKSGEKPTAYGFDEEDWGVAVVIALAALYDAEHKDDTYAGITH